MEERDMVLISNFFAAVEHGLDLRGGSRGREENEQRRQRLLTVIVREPVSFACWLVFVRISLELLANTLFIILSGE